MTDTMNALTLTVQKRIPAAESRVYNAWLNPEMMAKFMFGGVGQHTSLVETDPRVGGAYKVVMTDATKDVAHTGTYLELTPYSRIAFTWQSPYSVEGSTVTLDFAPDGDATMVTLTQVRFAHEGARDGHRAGWTLILDNLAKVAF
jgi:uncharacterized protein YndB with AHSA1/START domain